MAGGVDGPRRLDCSKRGPRHHRALRALLRVRACVCHERTYGPRWRELRGHGFERGDASECVGRNGQPRLCFNRRQHIPVGEHDVHLGTVAASEECEVSRPTGVSEVLQHLRRNPGLEDGTAERVRAQLLRRPDAEQIARQTRIDEVQLRCLHET